VTTTFDRLKPRTSADDTGSTLHDSEGKRALFSSNAPEAELPNSGSVSVECSRCGEVTVMSPFAAMRAIFPSLVLSVGVGRGEQESTVGVLRRHHGALMRCPACGRGSWTRLTVRL
jgi:predicted RNA-binding Zn-ribbon protein involved in translation (DUF1610 family)